LPILFQKNTQEQTGKIILMWKHWRYC